MHRIPFIAVSGGPCGGKSSFLAKAARWLQGHGIHPVMLGETSTELMTAGITPALLGLLPYERELTKYLLAREDTYRSVAEQIPSQRVVVFEDRGVFDAEAYMGEAAFREMCTTLGYNRAELMHRYAMVVHLVTAADGAEAFYTLENNAARTETPEQARTLDARTRHAWRGHPHLAVIDNSTDFNGKMQRALGALARVLHMPAPIERERRFLILNFDMSFIPETAARIDIVQTYLRPPQKGDRRVRASTLEGGTIYDYNEKVPTGRDGEAFEKETPITIEQYRCYLTDADPARRPLLKTRYRFPVGRHQFEIDLYESEPWKSRGIVKLEVELADMSEPIEIPAHWVVKEVTDDPQYLNSNMARAA